MAAFSGTAGSVVSSVTSTGLSEWSLDVSLASTETTTFGEVWDSAGSSVRNATGSFSGNADFSGGQNVYKNRFLAVSDYCDLVLFETATRYWTVGSALITAINPTINIKGKEEISYNFQVHGVITYT